MASYPQHGLIPHSSRQHGVHRNIQRPSKRRASGTTVELLEHRRLLSVTVAQSSPGYYEINSDNTPNDINISVSQGDQTFTLDGATYTGVNYISVFGNGGNDNINVQSVDGPGSIGASIDTGTGNDTVNLNFDGSIWCGGGNNNIHLQDSFRGEVYGGSGNDQIYVIGDCIDAVIDAGDGNDLIDASANNFGVVINGGAGSDTIIGSNYDDTIYGGSGTAVMYGMAGNDTFYSENGIGDQIYGGSGYNTLHANGAEICISDVQCIVYQ